MLDLSFTVAAPHRSFGAQTEAGALIYAVDDDSDLIELYRLLLAEAGYRVRTFQHRAQALAALQVEVNKPDLLITDYFGFSMRVQEFMRACRRAHPALRILMASGLGRVDTLSSSVVPDRFLHKPFTPHEFLEEVRAALAC
jgi:DNA-binding NtrC family response regulator